MRSLDLIIADCLSWATTIESERRADDLLDWDDLEAIRKLLLDAGEALRLTEQARLDTAAM